MKDKKQKTKEKKIKEEQKKKKKKKKKSIYLRTQMWLSSRLTRRFSFPRNTNSISSGSFAACLIRLCPCVRVYSLCWRWQKEERRGGKEKLTQAVVRDEKKKKKKNRNGRRMEKEVIVELSWVGLVVRVDWVDWLGWSIGWSIGWLIELVDWLVDWVFWYIWGRRCGGDDEYKVSKRESE